MMVFLLILSLTSIVCQASGRPDSSYGVRQRLYRDLVKNYSDDSQTTPPVTDMIVNVSIVIYNVFGISDSEVLEMNGLVKVTWTDPQLTWNSSAWSGVDKVIIEGDKVWKPDIGISNAKQQECKDFTDRERMYVEAKSTGAVSYFGYFMSDTPCPIVSDLFPFDEQACPVIISTYYSSINEFYVNIVNISFKDKNSSHVGQWKKMFFVSYGDWKGDSNDEEQQYQEYHILIVLQRKPLYHMVLVVMPYLLLAFLAAIIFAVQDPGMRLGVGLTVLLAKSVYIMIVSQGAPKSMITLSVLAKFLIFQMALLVSLTFICVLGPMIFSARESEEEGESEEDHVSNLIIRGVGYRIKKIRSFSWNRTCDYVWLALYFAVSFINAVVYLIVIPKMNPSYNDKDNWQSLLPAR